MQEPPKFTEIFTEIETLKAYALEDKVLGIFYRNPTNLSMRDWREWGDFLKHNFPIQFFFRETVFFEIRHYWWKLKNFFYYWRCKIFTPYNIVKLPIGPTYCYIDYRLGLAIETLLVEFIEKEKPAETINWNSDINHKEAWAAISDAYDFIKNRKPDWQDKIEKLEEKISIKYDSSLFELTDESREVVRQSMDLEEKFEKEKTRVYSNIVKYRSYLWT